jgi:hypothetical protein
VKAFKCAGVPNDAADVIECRVGKARIAFACEQGLAGFPERLVAMHAGAVIAENGFGHEGRGFAVAVRDVVHDMLVNLHVIGAIEEGGIEDADFTLARRNFMVMFFHGEAHALHDGDHFAANVREAVDRRFGEIAALDARAVAGIAGLVIFCGVVRAFAAVDFETDAVHGDVEFYIFENEEFGFGTEIGGVGMAGIS